MMMMMMERMEATMMKTRLHHSDYPVFTA